MLQEVGWLSIIGMGGVGMVAVLFSRPLRSFFRRRQNLILRRRGYIPFVKLPFIDYQSRRSR